MSRLQAFLECLGQALCEKGRKALQGSWPFADVLNEVARATYEHVHKKLPGDDLRVALQDAAACPTPDLARRIGEIIADLAATHAVPFKQELSDYLRAVPPTIRQAFRRPSDPEGLTAPEKLAFYKAEELLVYLPPRVPKFRAGTKPPGLDNWTLTELRGLGECSEVWKGEDPTQPEHSPAALKFAIDPESRDRVKAGTELFTQVFELNKVAGILPLRSVFLETEPPCLESPFVYGYDLTGLMFEWKWRYNSPKPEAALKLVRRLAAILATAHKKGTVHRDLKPSNVLLHPTEAGKFTMWVTDFGWGQIESVRSLELAKGGPRGEQQRLAYRGAATTLYASPQQSKKEPPAATDDIHALGVIWYQLLRRDPTAAAPVGTEWVEELRPHGFTDSQARVLQSCLSTRPDKRPPNAAALGELLAQVTVAPSTPSSPDGSMVMSLKNLSSVVDIKAMANPGFEPGGSGVSASAAAAMLMAAGGGPLTAGGPGTSSGGGVRVIKNSLGMTFVRVPAGSFAMGSPTSEGGHREHEAPVHEVKLSKPMFVSVTPVTQAQYEKVLGKNPAKFNKAHGGGPDHPVENVSWNDAVRFCDMLAQLPDEEVHTRSYRLPTEAEWEYMCRGGTQTAFAFGDKLGAKDGVFAGGGGKYSGKSTAPVAHSAANALGLHDMHGNAQEWVNDWYDEYYYFEAPPADPQGPSRGTTKVVRGGCWAMFGADCRSAARRNHGPDKGTETIGFRVVMVVG